MTTLLHICASPQGEGSESQALAGAFLDGYCAANPDVAIDYCDLFGATLPTFSRLAAEAKSMVMSAAASAGPQRSPCQAARGVFDRFAAADAYLFCVPIWNSGIPYVLNQWIDIVSQPGWLFRFDPELGYTGLITGKKVAAVYTSGLYAARAPRAFGTDAHSTYLNDWLGFAGFTDVTEIHWQPTVLGRDREADKAAALYRAAQAGRHF